MKRLDLIIIQNCPSEGHYYENNRTGFFSVLLNFYFCQSLKVTAASQFELSPHLPLPPNGHLLSLHELKKEQMWHCSITRGSHAKG